MCYGMLPQQATLIARSSSHLSRVTRLVAAELGLELPLQPVLDLTSQNPEDYGGNPALKVPVMHVDGAAFYGSLNICRKLWSLASKPDVALWPEDLEDPVLSNALETVLNGMGSEVPLIMHRIASQARGEAIAEPATLAKTRASLAGCLDWLEQHLPAVLSMLPGDRPLCFLRINLFCFLDHLEWREVMDLGPFPRLRAFRAEYALRPAARATTYCFD